MGRINGEERDSNLIPSLGAWRDGFVVPSWDAKTVTYPVGYNLKVKKRDSNLIPSLRLGGWFRGTLMGRKKTTYPIGYVVFLAYHEGFEPPTFWFVAKHSIRLS